MTFDAQIPRYFFDFPDIYSIDSHGLSQLDPVLRSREPKLEAVSSALHIWGGCVDGFHDGPEHLSGAKESKTEFLRTIELARKHPPQFLVEFILFPQLQSNNDLRLIKQWCRFIDSHKIPWIITVWSDASKAPKFLYLDPPEDAPDTVF